MRRKIKFIIFISIVSMFIYYGFKLDLPDGLYDFLKGKADDRSAPDITAPQATAEAESGYEDPGPSPVPSPFVQEGYEQNSDGAGGGEKAEAGKKDPDRLIFTPSDLEVLENLSLSDKLAGLAIASKLKSSDIDRITDIAGNGVTEKEALQIRDILNKRLNSKDMDKLKKILSKSNRLKEAAAVFGTY